MVRRMWRLVLQQAQVNISAVHTYKLPSYLNPHTPHPFADKCCLVGPCEYTFNKAADEDRYRFQATVRISIAGSFGLRFALRPDQPSYLWLLHSSADFPLLQSNVWRVAAKSESQGATPAPLWAVALSLPVAGDTPPEQMQCQLLQDNQKLTTGRSYVLSVSCQGSTATLKLNDVFQGTVNLPQEGAAKGKVGCSPLSAQPNSLPSALPAFHLPPASPHLLAPSSFLALCWAVGLQFGLVAFGGAQFEILENSVQVGDLQEETMVYETNQKDYDWPISEVTAAPCAADAVAG